MFDQQSVRESLVFSVISLFGYVYATTILVSDIYMAVASVSTLYERV
jgi:hypothetical protein